MKEAILGIFDRIVIAWFSYRQGKSQVIIKITEKLLKDIEVKNEIASNNANINVDSLLDNFGTKK